MLRRMLAALLIAVVAAPLPAMANAGCPMQRASVVAKASKGCDCCKRKADQNRGAMRNQANGELTD